MREAFLTRLEESLARRVTALTVVFGSNSDVLRLAVRVFFKLIDARIVSTDLVFLQALLQENEENVRNRVASAAREPVAATETLRGQTPLPQRRSASHRSEAKAVGAMAWSYPRFLPIANKNLGLGIITP